jgi:hypothetical protein
MIELIMYIVLFNDTHRNVYFSLNFYAVFMFYCLSAFPGSWYLSPALYEGTYEKNDFFRTPDALTPEKIFLS